MHWTACLASIHNGPNASFQSHVFLVLILKTFISVYFCFYLQMNCWLKWVDWFSLTVVWTNYNRVKPNVLLLLWEQLSWIRQYFLLDVVWISWDVCSILIHFQQINRRVELRKGIFMFAVHCMMLPLLNRSCNVKPLTLQHSCVEWAFNALSWACSNIDHVCPKHVISIVHLLVKNIIIIILFFFFCFCLKSVHHHHIYICLDY